MINLAVNNQLIPTEKNSSKQLMANITEDDITIIVAKIKNSKALNGGFDRLEESLDEVKADIKQIKECMHNPDTGIYTRINKVDEKAKMHQQVFDAGSKVFFLVLGIGLTILGHFLFG